MKPGVLRKLTKRSWGSAPFPGIKLQSAIADSDIFQAKPREVAQQLTLYEYILFQNVPLNEFLKKSYANPINSPAFTHLANHYNIVSLWVSSEIVKQKNFNQRADVIKYFIKVAGICKDINNFTGASAIMGGLLYTSISRLKKTWEKIAKSKLQILKDLETLFNPTRNYKQYRDILSTCELPAIPHIGIIPKDLIALEEVNPNECDGGLINLNKMRMVYRIVIQLRRFQKESYKIEPNSFLRAFFHELNPLSELEIYDLSRTLEPPPKQP